ncbi:MAG TPA: hypothetical protein VHZ51_23725 [Ktedonobacteraceae bacterium]|jgi:MFS family permease|nr:hypothetical protein [Ktedonobacteraceae bacterium]
MKGTANPFTAFISLFQQAESILIGSFILAVIITYLAYHSKGIRNQYAKKKTKKKLFAYHWYDKMGTPTWSFTTSWATTITTLGAVLGTILMSLNSDDQKKFQTEGVLGLSLFFGLVVLIAPLLYSAVSVHKRVIDQGKETPEYQGFVWMFTIICCLTLWAVYGQLVTVTNTLTALVVSDTFLRAVFITAVIISIVGVSAYAIMTVPWTIQDQLDKKKTPKPTTNQEHQHTIRPGVLPQDALEKHVQTFVSNIHDTLMASLTDVPQEQDQKVGETENESPVPAKGSWPLL